ncbi:S-adenosyl-L-methionine-dependent methyltransferase [Nemania abortiva]|nr:S-adenosyl-L-methionine-dependent methyltransferase [Nemania abortiva]
MENTVHLNKIKTSQEEIELRKATGSSHSSIKMSHSSSTATLARSDKNVKSAHALADSSEAQIFYDKWAPNYDEELKAKGYASPRRCVEALISNVPPPTSGKLKILDAACGTGLVGECLAQSSLAGQFIVDGVDLSADMLAEARVKGVYRDLETANLEERVEKQDSSYDLVMCVGALTKGHIGPNVLVEFARLTAKDGLIAATVHGDVWESGGYKAEIERLQDVGIVQIVNTEPFGIIEEADTGGIMVILKKK